MLLLLLLLFLLRCSDIFFHINREHATEPFDDNDEAVLGITEEESSSLSSKLVNCASLLQVSVGRKRLASFTTSFARVY